MSRRQTAILLLLASIPLVVSAAPVPKESDADRLRHVYGNWTDTDKDCTFALKKGELRVSLPKGNHLLAEERAGAKNNAPRALREVEGEFTAVVRVAIPPPERVPEEAWRYCSGGLVAWESTTCYRAVRSCAGRVNGAPGAVWSRNATPGIKTDWIQGFDKPAESVYLRLKRKGNKISTGWSRDGKAWEEPDPMDLTWGKKILVGVVAENCLDTPVEITFDQYSLTQPKK